MCDCFMLVDNTCSTADRKGVGQWGVGKERETEIEREREGERERGRERETERDRQTTD